jgi:hypothetical protein
VVHIQTLLDASIRKPLLSCDDPCYTGLDDRVIGLHRQRAITTTGIASIYDSSGGELLYIMQSFVKNIVKDLDLCSFVAKDLDEIIVFLDEEAFINMKLREQGDILSEEFIRRFLETQAVSVYITESVHC